MKYDRSEIYNWESRMRAKEPNGINMQPLSIKIRVTTGCFHRDHSPEAYKIIDEILNQLKDDGIFFEEHESGPEIIAWLALGTAGFMLAKSLIDLVTAVINARAKGREKGDARDGKLLLIVRDIHHTADSTEEVVMEIYDKDIVSSKQVKNAIESGIQKKFKKK